MCFSSSLPVSIFVFPFVLFFFFSLSYLFFVPVFAFVSDVINARCIRNLTFMKVKGTKESSFEAHINALIESH